MNLHEKKKEEQGLEINNRDHRLNLLYNRLYYCEKTVK